LPHGNSAKRLLGLDSLSVQWWQTCCATGAGLPDAGLNFGFVVFVFREDLGRDFRLPFPVLPLDAPSNATSMTLISSISVSRGDFSAALRSLEASVSSPTSPATEPLEAEFEPTLACFDESHSGIALRPKSVIPPTCDRVWSAAQADGTNNASSFEDPFATTFLLFVEGSSQSRSVTRSDMEVGAVLVASARASVTIELWM
jgi:hypothetical protein